MKGKTLLKRIVLASVLMLSTIFAGVVGANALSAPVGPLKIVRVGTDAMGTDTFANRNREYVMVYNTDPNPVDIAGLVVEDNWAHNNSFPSTCNTYKVMPAVMGGTVMLGSHSYVTVYNGAGVNVTTGNMKFYADSNENCGTAGQFFNNEADTVWVTNGTWVDSKSWDWNGGYWVH